MVAQLFRFQDGFLMRSQKETIQKKGHPLRFVAMTRGLTILLKIQRILKPLSALNGVNFHCHSFALFSFTQLFFGSTKIPQNDWAESFDLSKSLPNFKVKHSWRCGGSQDGICGGSQFVSLNRCEEPPKKPIQKSSVSH